MRLFFFALSLFAGIDAFASQECRFDPLDRGRVVIQSAQQLAPLKGIRNEQLSVMRVQGDQFIPVAFQIDELDERNQVWFKRTNAKRLGDGAVFDGNDQLLLMLTDAGPRASEALTLHVGEVLAELEVANHCYFYVVRNNPQRSDNVYVVHDISTGKTRTGLYELNVDPENELNWQHLGYRGYQGEGSIIKTLNMQMSAGVLSPFTRMTLDNHNLRPKMVGHSHGPIRSVMHLRTNVVLAGIPVMTLHVQAMRYAAHYEAHTYARVPDLYRATLKEPEVSVTVEGNHQLGAKVYTANFVDTPVVVAEESQTSLSQFSGQALSMDENWILFDSQREFALLTSLTVPEELMTVPLELFYEDSASSGGQTDQQAADGKAPNLGYRLKGWPDPKELRFTVSLYFDDNLHALGAAAFAKQRSETVPVSYRYP